MILYKYDERTREYLGYFPAYEDELETLLRKKPVYVIPPCSTEVKPFEPKKGHVAVFNGTDWEEVEDNRGKQFFNEKGESVVITELGPIPKGYTTERILSLKETKDSKLNEINQAYTEALDEVLKVGKMEVKQESSPYIYVTLKSFGEDCAKLNFEGEVRSRSELEKTYKYLYIRSLLLAQRKSELIEKVRSMKEKAEVKALKVNFNVKEDIKELLTLTIEEISERF